MLSTEQLSGSIDRQALDDVDVFATTIIPAAGITLGILVGQDRPGGFENRGTGVVFRSNQFEAVVLSPSLVLNG